MANYKVEEIEGIGPQYASKLNEAGVMDTDTLLERGASSNGRSDLAEATGISETLILEWVNHADLFRIDGVGQEYADLLEEAGVDSVPELAQRNPENLAQAMMDADEEKDLVRSVPSAEVVAKWVEQAKGLDRVVTH